MAFRSTKQKHESMGRRTNPSISIRKKQPPGASICNKHPEHQQTPGVCSICLNERLAQLSTARRRTARADSSSSSSSLSSLSSSHYSASCSSGASPVHHRHRDHRHDHMASRGKGFSLFLFKSGKDVLAKSRSVAFGVRRKDVEGQAQGIDDHGKRKGTFWSRLLHPKNKRIDASLSRSRTTN